MLALTHTIGREGVACLMAYRKGMHHTPSIVTIDNRIVFGIHQAQFLAQSLKTLVFKALLHPLPYIIGDGGDIVNAIAYCIDIHHAAACHEGDVVVATVKLLFEDMKHVLLEHRSVLIVAPMEIAYKVMLHSAQLFLGGRGSAYVHVAVYLT